MKSIIIGIVVVFFYSIANAMSWSELATLLEKDCPMSYPAKITTTGFAYAGSGIIELVTLGQINKDKLPSVYKEYMENVIKAHKEYAIGLYKALGPLSEGGFWQIQFSDLLGRHLQTYTIKFKGQK